MDPKKDQEQQANAVPEITETPDGGVEVALEEDQELETQAPETEEAPQKQEQDKKPASDDEIAKLRNQIGYSQRQIAKLQRELEASKNQPAPEPVKPQSEQASFLETIQKDPEGAIKRLVQSEAERIYQEEQAKIRQQTEQQTIANELDKNSQVALSRHPELNEQGSEKSEIWFNVLNQNPRWRTSPDGPLLTMYAMEDELRKRGYDVDGSIKKATEKEQERLTRVNQTQVPKSRPTIASGKVVLTKEQKELCDENGWDYATYARTLKKTGEREVTV